MALDKPREKSEENDSEGGGALEDALTSSSLASLVKGILGTARRSMPQPRGHSCTPSPFSLGLGTALFWTS